MPTHLLHKNDAKNADRAISKLPDLSGIWVLKYRAGLKRCALPNRSLSTESTGGRFHDAEDLSVGVHR